VRRLVSLLALLLLTWSSSISAQTSPSPGATLPTPGSVRILAPRSGDKISNNFVDFRYELASPASAAGSPTFQVRLDSAEPIRTTDTRYTFTGLQPGRHTLSVEVVDANNIPVQGSRAEVQFNVIAPQRSPQRQEESLPPRRPNAQLISAAASGSSEAALLDATFQQDAPEQEQEENTSGTLPQSSSSLPLLSLIGFAGLVGGLLSARHTRRH
jgi:hypothetical protein